MKVFYFILFLASASGLEYGPKDEDDFKDYLRGLKGTSARSAHRCPDKMFTVNGKEFRLLLNYDDCSQDRLKGSFSKIIQIYNN